MWFIQSEMNFVSSTIGLTEFGWSMPCSEKGDCILTFTVWFQLFPFFYIILPKFEASQRPLGGG